MQPQMHETEWGGAKQEGTRMTVIDAIYARRSVRSYGAAPVDGSSVQALLDAAVQAPSAMNTQPWGFVVVQDRALLRSYRIERSRCSSARWVAMPRSGTTAICSGARASTSSTTPEP